ncbi:MAG: arsenate reductase (glutaredoxin) [Polynucleobacter sp.]|nr:MAG: arsenate reductase (glutaredoxin) [Polynucleobacter sp.]
MSSLKIYHNPKCKTSRDVLELIQKAGIEPEVILYLVNPPSEKELRALIQASGGGVRETLRQKGTPYDELDLGNPKWTDDELIQFILSHPILLNRPIVSNGKKARLCRPLETVQEFF